MSNTEAFGKRTLSGDMPVQSEPRRLHLTRERAPIKVVTQTLELSALQLDPDNVRFRHLKKTMTDSDAEQFIWDEPETKQLYNSIISAGGLTENPIVTPEGIVKEGNRRIVCLRKAAKNIADGKLKGFSPGHFDRVQCEVLPSDVTQADIDVYLAQIHVVGKLEWDALNQAEALWRLYDTDGLSYDVICERVGISKSKLVQKIKAYRMTDRFLATHSTRDPSADVKKFSFFEEAIKKRDVRNWLESSPSNEDLFFNWIDDGKFNQTGAKDVRDLPSVWADKEAKAAFEAKGGTMKDALAILLMKDPARGSPTFAAISAAYDALQVMPRVELLTLPQERAKIEALERLRDSIEDLLTEVEQAQKAGSDR